MATNPKIIGIPGDPNRNPYPGEEVTPEFRRLPILRYPCIAVCGGKGVGKTETIKNLEKQTKLFSQVINFADPVKDLAQQISPILFTRKRLFGPTVNREDDMAISLTRLEQLLGGECSPYRSLHLETGPWDDSDKKLEINVTVQRIVEWMQDYHMKNGVFCVRPVLQKLSDEVKQRYGENVFVDIGLCKIQQMLTTGRIDLVLLGDVRFRSELLAIKALGGTLVKVTRSGERKRDTHITEIEFESIPDTWFDYIIQNDGNPQDLEHQTDVLLQWLDVPRKHD